MNRHDKRFGFSFDTYMYNGCCGYLHRQPDNLGSCAPDRSRVRPADPRGPRRCQEGRETDTNGARAGAPRRRNVRRRHGSGSSTGESPRTGCRIRSPDRHLHPAVRTSLSTGRDRIRCFPARDVGQRTRDRHNNELARPSRGRRTRRGLLLPRSPGPGSSPNHAARPTR